MAPRARLLGVPLLPLVLALLAWTALLSGCLPPQASYHVGLGTNRISGFLDPAPQRPSPGGSLIVVYAYHHTFIERGDGSVLLVPSAQVLRPGQAGDFIIEVPADVVRMEVLFIAADHLTQVFRFQRQVGVGDIDYSAKLPVMADWRSHYYTYLSPQLEELILDRRYRLAPEQVQMLSQWMHDQDARLAPGRRAPGSS
jgi:hypothetical protein